MHMQDFSVKQYSFAQDLNISSGQPMDLCGFQQRQKHNQAALFSWDSIAHHKWDFVMQSVAKSVHMVDDDQTICFDRCCCCCQQTNPLVFGCHYDKFFINPCPVVPSYGVSDGHPCFSHQLDLIGVARLDILQVDSWAQPDNGLPLHDNRQRLAAAAGAGDPSGCMAHPPCDCPAGRLLARVKSSVGTSQEYHACVMTLSTPA